MKGLAGRRAEGRAWWLQFPAPLREVASLPLIGSIGAAAVLYLTPLVFHQEAFSASSVTLGLAIAALAGTLGRFLSGLLLDRGVNCGVPVLLACIAALAADSTLIGARSFPAYAQGQVLMGIAMGLYWPAIELAVPLGCSSGSPPIPSARGFALARSADAAGIALGALIGALLASRGLKAPDEAALAQQMAARLQSQALRQESLIERPKLIYQIAYGQDLTAGLALSIENWQQQKEPPDAVLFAQAALARQQARAAEPLVQWAQTTGYTDPQLAPLITQLKAHPSWSKERP